MFDLALQEYLQNRMLMCIMYVFRVSGAAARRVRPVGRAERRHGGIARCKHPPRIGIHQGNAAEGHQGLLWRSALTTHTKRVFAIENANERGICQVTYIVKLAVFDRNERKVLKWRLGVCLDENIGVKLLGYQICRYNV